MSVNVLGIERNPELVDISALAALTAAPARLRIISNAELQSVEALSGISGAIDDVHIWDNPQLTKIGLARVESIGGTLSVLRNDSLQDLGSFDSLSDVRWLLVAENAGLTTLAGLDQLATVEYSVAVRDNHFLTSIDTLLAAKLVHLESEIAIHDNSQLPQCDVESVAQSLKPAGWVGTEDLTNNLGTCP